MMAQFGRNATDNLPHRCPFICHPLAQIRIIAQTLLEISLFRRRHRMMKVGDELFVVQGKKSLVASG